MTRRCHHRDEAAPAGRATLLLEPEALFLVGALRTWLAGRRGRLPEGVPAWREVFALASMPAAATAAFGTFLRAVERGMRRPLDVRCCSCPAVGRDEEALLRMLEALLRGDRLTACDVLEDWMVPEAVVPALDLATHLARLLAEAELHLEPARGAPRLERRTIAH
jgi:hypothetical protein